MGIIELADHQDIKRLCELFPIASLRQDWPAHKGTKEEICSAIAEEHDAAHILRFVESHFSCCKQHVYAFVRTPTTTGLPDTLLDGEKVLGTKEYAVYIIRCKYSVVLKNPLEEATLEFLWPVRVEVTPNYLIVRFVVLEKNLSSYFDRYSHVSTRSVDEKTVLQTAFPLSAADLHKGVKKLWADDFMDSSRVEYKKPMSTAQEEMDEQRGIKKSNPRLYAAVAEAPLFNAVFQISPSANITVSAFTANPSRGYIRFPRYSENPGDTDFVIREILRHN